MPGEQMANIALMTNPPADSEETAGEKAESFLSLVEQARRGDAAAFEQIMLCTQHRVARTAWRLLGHEEDARDATQEVFLRAYKYLGRFDQQQDFHAWLYRITINVCRDILRKRRRHTHDQNSSDEADHVQVASDAGARAGVTDGEEVVARTQQRALIARALDTLSKKERAALVLRDLEGLSTAEVARALGSSQTTVRSQISTARHKIKRYCDRFIRQRRPGV